MLNKSVGDVCSVNAVHISPDLPIREAIRSMAVKRMTSVVICEKEVPVGMLTARDLPRLYENHIDFSTPVRHVMSHPVTTCQPDISLLDALDIMLDKGIRHIPIVDQHLHIQGLVSESNIMDSLGSADLMRSQKVVEIMKAKVIQAAPDTPFSKIMETFQSNKIGSLVITDHGIPQGIITERDFPQLMVDQTAAHTPAQQIMSQPIVSISIHASAQDALLKMHQTHIHHLAVTGPSGLIKGIITRSCFFQDLGRYLIRKLVMTERRIKALSALQEDSLINIENFYIEATENAPHAIVLYKLGTIIYANKSACQMFGFEKKRDFIGHLLSDVFKHDEFKHEQDQLIEQDSGMRDKQFHLCTQQGSEFIAEVSSTVIVFEGETATLLTIKDITEQQVLEERFRQAQKMEAVGTLAGGIAHDFNNMLAGITGNIFLAKKRAESDATLSKKLHDIETLCFKASEVVSQLLTFSRKDAVKMQSLPMPTFVKETLKLVRVGIPENIKVQYDITSKPLMVLGDATQLNQIIINLLNNARDSLTGVIDPYIKVYLHESKPDNKFKQKHTGETLADGYACLTIADNGSGISSRDIDKVFEPFFTTKAEGKGTGLGLAMVYGGVQSHGGIIDVDSTPAHGTSFHVYLPLLDDSAAKTSANGKTGLIEGQGELILLADDDEQALSITREVLESIGYQVMSAKNGKEAVAIFENNRDAIDLFITDVVMPVLGGIEAAREIRALKTTLPVLFTTGYAEANVFVNHADIDKDQIITKPAHAVLLSQRIRKALSPKG